LAAHPRPYGPVSGAVKHPAGARPSKCIIITIQQQRGLIEMIQGIRSIGVLKIPQMVTTR
jgi:hypothetical protein